MTDGAAAKLLAELMGQAEVEEKDETLSYGLSSQRDGVSIMARRQMRDLVLTSEILTLPDMTGYLLVPGDYPIARVKYDYVQTEKQAKGFIERDGFSISFKPTTAAPAPAPADAPQPSVPGQADMLDDDDMNVSSTVDVMRNKNGDLIAKATGEIIKPATQVSRAKDESEAKTGDQSKKPSSLADAL